MKANDYKPKKSGKSKDLFLKIVVLIVAVVAACAIRFTVSSADLESSGHSKMWLGISFLTGIAGGIIYRKNFFVAGFITTAGFFIAVLLRIVYDLIVIDPASHNLFPIELVIWSIMAFIPAVAGAFLAIMILRLIRKSRSEKQVTKNKS
jgi:hypothetical protein